jgi:antitoxin HigA-1
MIFDVYQVITSKNCKGTEKDNIVCGSTISGVCVLHGPKKELTIWRSLTTIKQERVLMTLLPNMKPTHPGEIIREEFMAPLGLDVDQLARDLGIPSDLLRDIVSEKALLTDDIVNKLATRFETSLRLWTGLQDEYIRRLTVNRKNRSLRKKSKKQAPLILDASA